MNLMPSNADCGIGDNELIAADVLLTSCVTVKVDKKLQQQVIPSGFCNSFLLLLLMLCLRKALIWIWLLYGHHNYD